MVVEPPRRSIGCPKARGHHRPIVSKVFYCGGSAGRLGMLRAIVDLSILIELLSALTVHYVGECFPDLQEENSPSTVVEVTPDETQTGWRAGFYRIEKRPLEFEELLRSLRE